MIIGCICGGMEFGIICLVPFLLRKIKKMKTTPRTIDEVCGEPKGSFAKFVKDEKLKLQQIEKDRSRRIIKRLRSGK